jgi:hypothetical protein
VYSTVSAHHARLGGVASFVRRRLLQSRAGRSRGRVPSRDARVFRPCSRGTGPPRDMPTPDGEGAVASSLRPSAGGANGEAMPRARAVTPRFGPAVSSLPRLAAEPGPRSLWSGFSAPLDRDPTRLPRIQSMVGDQPPRIDHRPAIRRRHHRGPASVFRPPRAVASLREVNDELPRPGLSPSCRLAIPSSWGLAAFPRRHRRDASNPLLQPTFRVTSTRSESTTSGDFPPSAVGNPAGVRLRDPPRAGRLSAARGRRRTTSRSSGLQRLRARRHGAGFGPRGRAQELFRLPSRFAARTL